MAPQVVFDFLVSSAGAVIVFIYMAISVSQIVMRKRRELSGEPQPAVTMWLFPWLSYFAVAAMGAVLIAMAFTPGLSQDLKFSCITLAVAIAAYFVTKRLRRPAAVASVGT
jgi:L-asparagine transporter-like permease